MKRILTLASKEIGELSSLNGKIFYVKINPDTNHAIFVDVLTNVILRETTSVVKILRTDTTITFSTSSGKTYNLVDILSLIPSFENTNNFSPMIATNEEESKKLTLKQFDLLFHFKGCINVVQVLEYHNIVTIGDIIMKLNEKFDFISFFKENLPNRDPKKLNEAILDIIRSVGYLIDEKNNEIKFEGINNYFSSDFKAIARLNSYKSINYGDGYDKSVFVFNRKITEEEFIQFCKDNNLRLHKAEGWWDDHSLIQGSDNTWIHTWVLAYTD